MTWKRWVCILATALVASGCATDEGAPGSTPTRSPAEPTSTSSPTSAATPYDPMPWAVAPGLDRCGPQPQRVQDQAFRRLTLRDPDDATLPAVTTGAGRTVVVLLHQTDGNGFCGWLGFAQEVAQEPGVTVLAPDLCGYGEATCRPTYSSEQQTDQVRLAVSYAEHQLNARRIVLVGASMGGSLAMLTAAEDPRVDAVVDLSGPDAWTRPTVSAAARRLAAPALVAMASDEGSEEVAAARAAVDAAPAGSEFVEPTAGHGYALLAEPDGRPTDLAARVLAWIREA